MSLLAVVSLAASCLTSPQEQTDSLAEQVPRLILTMRFGSTAKVLLKCKLKYYRISECILSSASHWILWHLRTQINMLKEAL